MRLHPPKLVALDQDDEVLRQVARVFGGTFLVLQVRNPSRALALMQIDREVRAIVTEQVMRGADGVELLETIRTMRPDVRRVMFTTYRDLARIVSGLHSGAIHCLLAKPATDAELFAAVCPELAQRSETSAVRRASA